MKKFSMILAIDENNGIGKDNGLCWKISQDMKYFKKITEKTEDINKKNLIIMGRKTWESIPSQFKPLPNRINCILSRSIKNKKNSNNIFYFNDFDKILKEFEKKENIENIFLIGGGNLYNQFINHPKIEKIYITKIFGKFDCDTFFRGVPENLFKIEKESKLLEENNIFFKFIVYKRI